MPRHTATSPIPERISIADAARLLGVHQDTIRRFISNGKLAAVRIPPPRANGTRPVIRVLRADVEALMRPITTI